MVGEMTMFTTINTIANTIKSKLIAVNKSIIQSYNLG